MFTSNPPEEMVIVHAKSGSWDGKGMEGIGFGMTRVRFVPMELNPQWLQFLTGQNQGNVTRELAPE